MRWNKNTKIAIASLAFLLLESRFGWAQLAAPNTAGVSIGHAHLVVPDSARQIAIWESLGGELVATGEVATLKFPGVYLLLSNGEARLPSPQTTANHIGFSVRDYTEYKAKLLDAGASLFFDSEENGQILADLPDGIRVEILTDANQSEPIVFHHMHVAAHDGAALRDWYMRVFGAEAGERRGLPSALVPGGRVDILGINGPEPQGSHSGVLDHIGFEVADMAAFADHLKEQGLTFEVEPMRIEGLDLTIAFLTDPAGTYIEVTDGLASVEP
ncbi:MAG: VOC family protein [Pseudomonadales bacterium]|jgi:catechol 2,3-dioxygenase-like lactoylglutathione lyase family enzyme|nr:VOC family protein [Pseudomonadales bacterium]